MEGAKKLAGLPPGNLDYSGPQRDDAAHVEVIRYMPDECRAGAVDAEYFDTQPPDGVAPGVEWTIFHGVHDPSLLSQAGKRFALDALLLEDIAHVGHRPKYEDMGDYLFTILRNVHYADGVMLPEQVSMAVGPGWVALFLDRPADWLQPVRKRLTDGRVRIRKMGADYLFYAITDALMDNYLVILEQLDDEIADLEETILENPDGDALTELHRLRRNTYTLARWLRPMRDVLSRLRNEDSDLIASGTRPFLGDLYEHVVLAQETAETHTAHLATLFDTCTSAIDLRTNSTMQLLTVVATIFIPLTFIAGVYGMNFDHMPELHWRYGYFIIWGLMIAAGVAMLWVFKRKRLL